MNDPKLTHITKQIRTTMLNLIRQGCCGMSLDELRQCVGSGSPELFLEAVRSNRDIAQFVLEGDL